MPENLWRNEVIQTVAINKDRHVRIFIECREIHSPLKGRIHFRRLFSSHPFFLQFCGGPYIFAN